MSEKIVSVFLIGFSVVFLIVILSWRQFKKIFSLGEPAYDAARLKYDRLRGIHIVYRIILVAFSAICAVYFFVPSSKKWFHVIQLLDNDYVNSIGFVILFLAFILVLSHQIKLDKSTHLYYADESSEANAELVPKTEARLLKSILLVYTGMFVVVSTVATGLLLLLSFLVYYLRSTNRKYKIKTHLPARQQLYY